MTRLTAISARLTAAREPERPRERRAVPAVLVDDPAELARRVRSPHVAQVLREADEQTPLFAETWHSDWSFLPSPPSATVLYGDVIPPVGGDTLFGVPIDQLRQAFEVID